MSSIWLRGVSWWLCLCFMWLDMTTPPWCREKVVVYYYVWESAPWYICNEISFTLPFLLGTVPLDCPPVLWWLSHGEGRDAVTWCGCDKLKMAQLLEIKARVSSLWAKECNCTTLCVYVLSDLTWLPLLCGGRKPWYIFIIKTSWETMRGPHHISPPHTSRTKTHSHSATPSGAWWISNLRLWNPSIQIYWEEDFKPFYSNLLRGRF